eukprot:s1379_g16.t1
MWILSQSPEWRHSADVGHSSILDHDGKLVCALDTASCSTASVPGLSSIPRLTLVVGPQPRPFPKVCTSLSTSSSQQLSGFSSVATTA